jgi:hypothetical protein
MTEQSDPFPQQDWSEYDNLTKYDQIRKSIMDKAEVLDLVTDKMLAPQYGRLEPAGLLVGKSAATIIVRKPPIVDDAWADLESYASPKVDNFGVTLGESPEEN